MHPIILTIRLIRKNSLWIATVLLTGAVFAESEIAGWDDLVDTYYRFEVINYCSLGNNEVTKGFHRQRDALLQVHQFNPQQIDSMRGEAWQAAHREWDNRGLGGFRGWCKKEGRQYARDFTDFGL